VQHVDTVVGDLVAGDEDHALGVELPEFIGRVHDVVIAEHEEAVAERGVGINDALRGGGSVGTIGVRVQVALEPSAGFEIRVGMLDLHGGNIQAGVPKAEMGRKQKAEIEGRPAAGRRCHKPAEKREESQVNGGGAHFWTA
jgi:hypothetical protein